MSGVPTLGHLGALMAMVLPGMESAGLWQVRSCRDAAACAMADRHYSRRRSSIGSGKLGGPNRRLVLVAQDERAVWVTTWPEFQQDGMDSWRCSVFRNEGSALSSALILEAMDLTCRLWTDRPRHGWSTYVDTAKVRSANPGYCFKRAGWVLDRTYRPDRRRRSLIRLTCTMLDVCRTDVALCRDAPVCRGSLPG